MRHGDKGNGGDGHPCAGRILALLDGELEASHALAVREHCAACPRCREVADTIAAVDAALATVPAPAPLAPMWPRIRQELREKRAARPRFGLSFAFGTSLAAATGVALGIFVGSLNAPPSDTPLASQGESLWSLLGSTITGDTGAALFDTYVSTGDLTVRASDDAVDAVSDHVGSNGAGVP